jgi:hypothetical protein
MQRPRRSVDPTASRPNTTRSSHFIFNYRERMVVTTGEGGLGSVLGLSRPGLPSVHQPVGLPEHRQANPR